MNFNIKIPGTHTPTPRARRSCSRKVDPSPMVGRSPLPWWDALPSHAAAHTYPAPRMGWHELAHLALPCLA